MELRVLEYFLAVVEEGNISRAAQALHMTQPSLSRQIHDLERELGAELFVRGRHLALTDEGIMLRRRAEEVMQLVGKIRSDFADVSHLEGTVSIGAGMSMSAQRLSALIRRFLIEYPDVSFNLRFSTAERAKELLGDGVLDFALLLEPTDLTGFEYLRIGRRERWGLLLPARHPLAAREGIANSDLTQIPLATTTRSPIRHELSHWLGAYADEVRIVATYNVSPIATSLVEEGVACLLCVEGATTQLDPERMVFRPLEPELSMSSVIAWKRAGVMGNAAAYFLDYVMEHQDAL